MSSPSYSSLVLCVVTSLVINLSAFFLFLWQGSPKAGNGQGPGEAISLNFQQTAIMEALLETAEGNSASAKGGVTEQAAVEEQDEAQKEEGEKTGDTGAETRQDTQVAPSEVDTKDNQAKNIEKPVVEAEKKDAPAGENKELASSEAEVVNIKDPQDPSELNIGKKSGEVGTHILPETVPQSKSAPEVVKQEALPERKVSEQKQRKERGKSRKARREEQKRKLAQTASERGLNTSGEQTAEKEGGRVSGADGNSRYYKELDLRIRRQIRHIGDRTASGSGVITFLIDQHGKLVSARISKTSGSEILDEAVLNAVRRAAPFPKPAQSVPKLKFDFPYTYQ